MFGKKLQITLILLKMPHFLKNGKKLHGKKGLKCVPEDGILKGNL